MTVTVRAAFQSPGVKVSEAGPTSTASVSDVPSAPRARGVTVTSPDGGAASTTVKVAVPPASATVSGDWGTVTVTPGRSASVTVTARVAVTPS